MPGYKFSLNGLVCLVGSLGPGVLEASAYEKLFLSRALSFQLLKSGGGVSGRDEGVSWCVAQGSLKLVTSLPGF